MLNGDQYTKGHTLVILGAHRCKITDDSLTKSELMALAEGLNKVSIRLKKSLGAETIHVLSLCEGIEHLHFHLIPRYAYTEKEKQFYIDNYFNRENDIRRESGKKEWGSKKGFEKDIDTTSIHGMWYAAYHEMSFTTSKFWRLAIQDRVKELENTAKLLRTPNLRNPFASGCTAE